MGHHSLCGKGGAPLAARGEPTVGLHANGPPQEVDGFVMAATLADSSQLLRW